MLTRLLDSYWTRKKYQTHDSSTNTPDLTGQRCLARIAWCYSTIRIMFSLEPLKAGSSVPTARRPTTLFPPNFCTHLQILLHI